MGKIIFNLILIVGLVTGYIINFKNAVQADWAYPYEKEAFAFAGVLLPPLGALNGVFKFGDNKEVKLTEGVK